MLPADLTLVRTPGVPTLSPDGRRAVVAVTRLDLDKDTYLSDLWLVTTDGSVPPRRLTTGHRDAAPRWSPDGRWLAFLRAEAEGKPQLHLLPTEFGDARPVTTDEHHPLGAGAARWSPDSTRLVYTARIAEPGRYGTKDANGKEHRGGDKEPPRRITSLRYREDDIGFVGDRRRHVFVVDPFADRIAPVQVTDGGFDDDQPAWSPDGTRLAFVSDRDAPQDTSMCIDVYTCAVDGSDVRRLTPVGYQAEAPAFTPDGGSVLFLGIGDLGPQGREFVGNNGALRSVPVDGSAEPVALTDVENWDVLDVTGGVTVDAAGGVLVGVQRRGAVDLVRVPLAGGTPVPVVEGEVTVTGAAGTTDGRFVLATVGTAVSAGELVAVPAVGDPVTLTDFGAELTARGGLRPMAELHATAPDGYPAHGWVVRPDPERFPGPRPVLHVIHGGPYTQHGWNLFDEAQVYAGAGYLVVLGNPRGASGYGQAHGRAIQRRMGTVDADDLSALLDAALALPEADADRVGVQGGSYGGFMTTWLAGHTGHRYRAAISERAVNVWDSFIGSSDIGYFFAEQYAGDDPAKLAEQSPLTYADKIDIPMLIIHSEEDWRCPVEQAQRLFVKLRQNGTPAELLLFPGEGHELSRSGLPSHRTARFAAILDWWERHLSA